MTLFFPARAMIIGNCANAYTLAPSVQMRGVKQHTAAPVGFAHRFFEPGFPSVHQPHPVREIIALTILKLLRVRIVKAIKPTKPYPVSPDLLNKLDTYP